MRIKIDLFFGTPLDPYSRDRFHRIIHPWWRGEWANRRACEVVLREYPGMMYIGRARTREQLILAEHMRDFTVLEHHNIAIEDTVANRS